MRKIIILTVTVAMFLSFGSQALAEKILINYSPYTNGLIPGNFLDENQITADLTRVQSYAYGIKIFSCVGEMQKVLQIAKKLGLPVIAGCWIGKNKAQNEIELAALIDAIRKGYAAIAVIGSEALHRGDVTATELVDYINRFKEATKDLPIKIPACVAESYNVLRDNPAVVDACNIVMLNIYPYWEGTSIDNAVAQMRSSYWGFRNQFPNAFVVIGETGWPSAGNAFGAAVPSTYNAALYFWETMSWAKTEGIYVIWFEDRDERWKIPIEGPQGAHWGLFDEQGHLKQYMEYGFSDYILARFLWTYEPGIMFTHIPPVGSNENLEGKVYNVSASDYRVVIYIRVGTGWWIKPLFANPYTTINPDGSWTCDITTGGSDKNANTIAAFVVPKGYVPPALGGSGTLPDELTKNSVARIQITR